MGRFFHDKLCGVRVPQPDIASQRHAVVPRLTAWAVPLVATFLLGCGGTPTPMVGEAGTTPDDRGTDGLDGSTNGDRADDLVGSIFPEEDDDPAVKTLDSIDNQLLLQALPGADPADVSAGIAAAGGAVLEQLPQIQTTVLEVDPVRLTEVAAALAADPLFERVGKNYLYEPETLPDDPRLGAQSYLEAIGMAEAWAVSAGSPDILIAVLDTGVEPDHPDLSSQLVPGWNLFDDNNDTRDVLGHGTAVAGTVAAAGNNGVGVAGIAWGSPITPLRVTDGRGRASTRRIAAAIVWAADHGARVINVSFAPLSANGTVLRAARYARNAGALVFISSGNDGRRSPARDSTAALFVGAASNDGRWARFSTTGPFLDLAAPGVSILTTAVGATFARRTGTSFASPIAAGVAALIWSVNPDLRPVTVEQLLKDTALDLGPEGRDEDYGAGLVNAAAALAGVERLTEAPDRSAPTVRIISPVDASSVSGKINVTVSADDDVEIGDVVLLVDGQPFATDAAEPFRFGINTRRIAAGVHTLTAVATDVSGNATSSANVRIITSAQSPEDAPTADRIPPEAVVNFPAAGTIVPTRIGIRATLTDNVALARVDWLVDGIVRTGADVVGTRQIADYTWDASGAAAGTHTITVRVRDQAGNQAAASVELTKR